MTREQIEAFQRDNADHYGKPLVVDGVRGPRTEWAIDFVTLCEARRTIIRSAQLYVGLCEEPPASNNDPRGIIRAWLARCYAVAGEPWCAAFASYALSTGLPQQIRIGNAQALGKRFAATSQPLAGDLFWFPTGPVRGHVGIVIGTAPGEVMTIEGNCGNAVRLVRRERAELRFSRTVDDVSGSVPGVIPGTPSPPRGTR